MSAAEAAAALHVNRATLYAYVSRGYVRSQSMPGPARRRGYSRDDVEKLRRRTEERRNPDKATARALQWGMPVLESSITLIDGKTLYYRGHDAVGLAQTRTLREVASLIWLGRFEGGLARVGPPVPRLRRLRAEGAHAFVGRAQSILAAAAGRDPMAGDSRATSVAECGWRILHHLTAAAAHTGPPGTIDRMLARAWNVNGSGVDVLRAALILCADHELNVSSFTARCVASAGSTPYAVVVAGLAALEGTRHGGVGARVDAMLQSIRRAKDVKTAIAARLRRGEHIDGFGHPLYPGGDPRATMLLGLLRRHYAKSAELRFILDFATAAAAVIREKPNVDFALAALGRVLRLPSGAPLALFAIGRAIGWIGHAIEQYATGQLIRPRAKYIGVVPADPPPVPRDDAESSVIPSTAAGTSP
jgi:citrate synthase